MEIQLFIKKLKKGYKKSCERYQSLSKEKTENKQHIFMNVTKISQI